VAGAVFTTVNEAADGTGHCKNGNPGVNCNIYDGKGFVWLNGGPLQNGLSPDGTYFFAVLVPGGQNADVNDGDGGGAGVNKNLSDDFDTYLNRTFTVTTGEVSAYTGTHDFDNGTLGAPPLSGTAPFIRLMPYADTTNNGGEYIMAVCKYDPATYHPGTNPVNPNSCKYDAFKVKAAVPPQDMTEIDVLKFCDANADGFLNLTEMNQGLAGWAISFNPSSCSGTTDTFGTLTCVTDPGPYSIGETVQPNFAQTATGVDGFFGQCSTTTTLACNPSGPSCPSGETCVANGAINPVSHDAGVGSHTVSFGNVGLSSISGRKFDDRNANGVDDSETGVAGVKILLSGVATNGNSVSACAVTDGSGNYSFPNLLPGSYTVTEVKPTSTFASTATSCSETLAVDEACAGTNATCSSFGNVCLGAGGGHTLGFWSNKVGQAALNDESGSGPELAILSSLNLRNASGADFDPATYAALRTWLLSATATNMAYMLSAQLTAMVLNVEANFISNTLSSIVDNTFTVSGSSLVYAPSCGNTGVGNNFITVSNLISQANAALGADGYTPAGDPNRTLQECLKNALDGANNNQNFVVACPAFGATCQ